MACNKCDICKYTDFEYVPKGTDNPEIYFISEAMSSEDNKNHDIFTSSGHKMLLSMLDAFGINFNNSRFAHIIRCYPQVSDYDTSYRKPSQIEINNCKEYLINDIIKCNPKLIVTLGGLVSKEFIGDEFSTITKCHGNLYHKRLTSDIDLPFGDEYLIFPMYHPSFVERRAIDRAVRMDYKTDIKKIIDICNGSYNSSNNYNNRQDYEDETVQIFSYEDFDKFCKQEIDNSDFISYDNETNAESVLSSRHRVVGFSLASRSKVGCYVTLESLDFKMNDKDKKLIEARLRKIFITKRILTYNCMHELPTTLNWLGIEIPKIDDLFVIVKLLMGNAGKYIGNGGLKIQCQMNLGCNDWSEDLDTYFDYLRDFKNKKSQMTVLLSKYYKNEQLDYIIDLVENLYNDHNGKFDKVISYGLVPCNLISKYGGIDSSILFDLWEFYQKKMIEFNNKYGINLDEGYKYWMNHHIAGYTLERNGAYWNDEVASDIEEWCNEGLVTSLTELIKSPLSEDIIRSKLENNFASYIKENYLMKILGNWAVPKRAYKNTVHIILNDIPNNELEERLKKMSMYPNDKGIVKLELGHILSLYNQLFDDKDELFNNFYHNFMNEFLSSDKTDDELRGLLNPRSTLPAFKDFMSRILITPSIIYAKFYDNLVKYIESPKFSIDDYMDPRFANDRKLLELMIKFKYDENMSSTRKLQIFTKFIDSVDNFMSYNIKNRLNSAMEYHFDSLDDDHIIELYNLYEMTGIDIEDRSTWNEEFKWLYYFRYYKKFAKILSTYINAKVGRNNVWYVDKESYVSGNTLTKRDIKYNEVVDGTYSKNDIKTKIPIYQPDFKVDFADTGRWACFTGDIKIKCLDGNSYSFDELVNSKVRELWVYSRDNEGNIVPALAINPHISKRVTKLCVVTLDTGEIIRCTPDHRFMLRDGSYKEAQYLTKDDSIMPLYLKYSDKGYIQYFDDNDSTYKNVHTLVNNFCNSDYKEFLKNNYPNDYSFRDRVLVTHHKNFNKLNNNPDNLKWMYSIDHWKYHAELGRERLIEYNKSEKSDEWRRSEKHRNNARETRIKFNKSEKMRNSSRRVAELYLNTEENRISASHRMIEMNKSSEGRERSRRLALSGKCFMKTEEDIERDRQRIIARNKNEYEKRKMIRGRVLKVCRKILDDNYEINEDTYKLYKSRTTPTFINALNMFDGLDNLIQSSISYNHKISNIEIIECNPTDVYDLSVPGFNNFALDCGVFVHNSGFHTLPAGRSIKRIFTSRFDGGMIAMPDCSQAEVRVLAAVSGDENLMNAFMQKGMDIHKYVASMIFHNGDMSQVTSRERKVAKGAVFGLLYGESERSFAESFFHGDITEATKVYDYFYTAFPKIKDYVDDAHNMFLTTGKISLKMFNRFIDLEPQVVLNGGDKDRVLRQAQNFIIQGSTCLAYDTEIKMLDGTSKKIGELANSDINEFYVYSYDENRDMIVPSKAIFARKTKDTNNLVKITLDNEEIIECTYNHRFLKRSGEYCEAQNLKIGDSLMSMYIRLSNKIVNIEYINYNKSIPVYDITVPKYGNFVLASGVIVHNCDLAGMILYNICEFVKTNNLKSKPFCFIHDSIEIDINPDELFYMLDNLTPLFNEYPMKAFGVPMASDIVFSCNMGAEIEMVDLIHDEDYNEVTIKLEGFADDIDDVEKEWNRVYDVCEKLEEELGEKQYVSYKGLFQKKVVISKDFGTYRQTCTRTYHIIRRQM